MIKRCFAVIKKNCSSIKYIKDTLKDEAPSTDNKSLRTTFISNNSFRSPLIDNKSLGLLV